MGSDRSSTQLVVILEDIAETREWLRAIARDAFPMADLYAFATLGEAGRWLSTHASLDEGKGFLALIDIGLPDGSGIDFIRALLARLPHVRPIVTTLYDDDDNLMAAMAAGAQGYLLKDHEPSDLVRRLQAAERGEAPLSPAMAERILAHFRTHARFVGRRDTEMQLTPRETDVLRLVGRGLKVSEAATSLGLSDTTVAGYLKTIYRKLEIGSRAEAAVEAVRRGLV